MHADEDAVRATVERFLEAAGRFDLDAIERMVVPEANIASVSARNGAWVVATMTAEEWLAQQRARVDPVPYSEPVHDWTVLVDGGHLALVRADAVLSVDGVPRSHNVDFFTLVKLGDDWKFLSLSYVSTPIGST